ncbi:MAG: DUF554 domain-containing protein [Treponema sp.]|jgi:uncharacterized membrane protein YqgA involved in biofilm formation|nr:DUF554 domain-containing protein [Treponema sp.]
MLGPAVNAIVIVVCALVGMFLVRGIPERFEEIIKKAIGLSIIYVGIKGAFDNQRVLLLIMSMVCGGALGELININGLMNRLGLWAERQLSKSAAKKNAANADGGEAANSETPNEAAAVKKERSFSKGFVTASILYCSGSMAIVGSMQSGLQGIHDTLFAKSILDGAISIVFGASMGIGVVFSAIPVFLYQAGIALAAMAVKDILTPDIIREMSAVGSLLVAAIGFNFLGVKEIKVANFIPAIFIPLIYLSIEALFS